MQMQIKKDNDQWYEPIMKTKKNKNIFILKWMNNKIN